MNRFPRRQRGMVLIVTLAMLVVITLFVISMIRLGNTNAIIVGNMQAQKGVEAEAQQAIEIAVNKFSFFDDAIQSTNTWLSPATDSLRNNEQYATYSGVWTAYLPTGATAAPATRSDDISIAPQDTYWDVAVAAGDSKTGATSEIHQGLQVRLPAGNCK